MALPIIFVAGSSNAAGMGASDYIQDPAPSNGFQDAPSGWVGLLRLALKGKFQIINWSTSGQGSGHALRNIQTYSINTRPDVVLFCPNPVNDGLNLDLYLSNCRHAYDLAKQVNCKFVVRGGYCSNYYTGNDYERVINMNKSIWSEYEHVIDHMSCLDLGDGHYKSGKMYTDDGLHPNDAGYRILYSAIKLDTFSL